MIDFTEATLNRIALHNVGNKTNEESLALSSEPLELRDAFLKDVLIRYFTAPFKSPSFFNFQIAGDDNEVYNAVSEVFQSPGKLFDASVKMATLLYDRSEHPKIKAGEFYMVYFENIVVDEETVNAVGLFKSENKDTYLKVFPKNENFELACDMGININKLDKGCIVFNSEKEEGYRLCIVDAVSGGGEEARYWKDAFLNVKYREDKFHHTSNFMKLCADFCEEVLTEDNQVAKRDQVMIKNRTADYFKNNDKFNVEDFTKEVMEVPEVIESFNEYKQNFFKKGDIQPFEEFEISPEAVKQTKKMFRNILKLDKNFHVYIHGNHDCIQKGFDPEKNMNYYQLFFNQEL